MARRLPATFTTIALVLALAVLVAVASHGTPVWTLLRDGRADRPEILADIAVLCGLGTVVAVAVALVVHHAFIARRTGAPPLRTTLLRALPIATAALAVLSLLVIARTDLERGAETAEGPVRAVESSDRRGRLLGITDWWDSRVLAGEGQPEPDRSGAAGPDPAGRVPPLLILAGAIAAAFTGAAAWRWYARRSAREPLREEDGPTDDPDHGAVQEAVAGTIDAMLADPDPNTAIRGAYARLLEGLDACGTGRRDHEGPMEHLHRVLTLLRVRPEPLRELIELFEAARFSTRPLASSHREQALRALRAVAADLAAFPSPSLTAGSRPAAAR